MYICVCVYMNTNIYIHILWKHTYTHIQQWGGLFKELRTTCPVEVFRKQGSFFSVRITVVAAPECQVSLTPTQWSKKCLHRPTSHLPASYLLNYPALCFLQGGNCLNMVSHKFLTTPPYNQSRAHTATLFLSRSQTQRF